jgi:hypothetical protein
VSLYGDTDMTRVMYGENARHAPAWLYTQGPGEVVQFVGASAVQGACHWDCAQSHGHRDNPLVYGANRWPIQFIVGEIIVRPHLVIGTDSREFVGMGLGGLATAGHDMGEMLAHGELIAGSEATLARIRRQAEG